MSNPLYQQSMQFNPLQMLPQLMNNPIQFALQQKGFNIPPNLSTNPNAMIQYLLNSGKVTQNDYNQAIQTANAWRNFKMNGF